MRGSTDVETAARNTDQYCGRDQMEALYLFPPGPPAYRAARYRLQPKGQSSARAVSVDAATRRERSHERAEYSRVRPKGPGYLRLLVCRRAPDRRAIPGESCEYLDECARREEPSRCFRARQVDAARVRAMALADSVRHHPSTPSCPGNIAAATRPRTEDYRQRLVIDTADGSWIQGGSRQKLARATAQPAQCSALMYRSRSPNIARRCSNARRFKWARDIRRNRPLPRPLRALESYPICEGKAGAANGREPGGGPYWPPARSTRRPRAGPRWGLTLGGPHPLSFARRTRR